MKNNFTNEKFFLHYRIYCIFNLTGYPLEEPETSGTFNEETNSGRCRG